MFPVCKFSTNPLFCTIVVLRQAAEVRPEAVHLTEQGDDHDLEMTMN